MKKVVETAYGILIKPFKIILLSVFWLMFALAWLFLGVDKLSDIFKKLKVLDSLDIDLSWVDELYHSDRKDKKAEDD